jgi:hypothetical protein
MSGDGLTDIVRIGNGEICYWPNLGYGRFGARVTMDGAPRFDHCDRFDPRRIRLADIDGTGPVGPRLSRPRGYALLVQPVGHWLGPKNVLTGFPPVDGATAITSDVLGNGTSALAWSSPLADDSRAPMKVLTLMAEGKPHLLTGFRNNLGAETRIGYAPSTWFYLATRLRAGPGSRGCPSPSMW